MKTQIIVKVNKKYSGEDCLQVMLGYSSKMLIINNTEVQFYSLGMGDVQINSYVLDKRRLQFPYSDRPTHYTKRLFQPKFFFVNQLLTFGKPYILIRDGSVSYISAHIIGDESYILGQPLCPVNQETFYFTGIEAGFDLSAFIHEETKSNGNSKTFFIDARKRLVDLNCDEETKERKKREYITYLLSHGIKYKNDGNFIHCDTFEEEDKVLPNTRYMLLNSKDTGDLYFITVDGTDIHIRRALIQRYDEACYKVIISDMIYNKDTDDVVLLNALFLSEAEIKTLREPVFTKRLNRQF